MRLVGAFVFLDCRIFQLAFFIEPQRTAVLARFCRTVNQTVAILGFVIAHHAEITSAEFALPIAQIFPRIARQQKRSQIIQCFRQKDFGMKLFRQHKFCARKIELQQVIVWNAPPDPVLSAVASLVTPENEKWCGSSTELAAALGTEMKPNALSMRLNIRAAKLEQDYHIRYESIRTHAGRQIILTYLR